MDELSATFAALADPTRRAILARLAQGQTHVGALAEPFAISAPAISRHLGVLERAGLIRREVDAQWRLCRLQAPPLQAAHDWLDRYRLFWEHSLDRLVDYVEQQQRGAVPAPRPRPARTPRLARTPKASRSAAAAPEVRAPRKPRKSTPRRSPR